MRRVRHILPLLLLLPVLAWAAVLMQFSGLVLDDQTVELRWRVDSPAGVVGFEVERSTDSVHFQMVGERVPVAGLDYVFLDRPGLNATNGNGRDRTIDIEQAYYYSLYYVMSGGTRVLASSEPLRLSFQLSTVSVTWGSIKAMFR